MHYEGLLIDVRGTGASLVARRRQNAERAPLSGGCAEPEPCEQQGQRHDQTADAVDDERGVAADMPDQPAEVLAEEGGDEGQWQEDRREDRELLDGGVLLDADLRLLDGDHRYVGLQERAEQVALGGY